jgi:hypothetical protein
LDSIATFVADRFNTTVKDSLRRDCFGDDLAAWLGEELRANGYSASATPILEDFGWAVKFDVSGRSYFASIGYVPGKVWFIAIERGGLLARFFSRFRRIPDQAVEALKSVLVRSADIRDLRWHSPRTFAESIHPGKIR